MKYLYAILSWGMVALGVLHMLATFRLFHTVNTAALWFFSGGIALVLTGMLNLLHRMYGRIAPGVRRVCIGTNIFMTCFGVVSGIVSQASIAEFTLVLGLIGGATVFSFSPSFSLGNTAPKNHSKTI